MRCILTLLPLVLALSSCSSPPKPPTVEESRRRPANTRVELELQACRVDLQNTRIAARESDLLAEAAKNTVTRLRLQAHLEPKVVTPEQPNTIHSFRFAFGSTQVSTSDTETRRVIDVARVAPLIRLSGRTDGTSPNAAESRIARERAEAVRTWLVQAGIDPARIRTTWQPIGDHAADNATEVGRDLNRRVEIELYRFSPRHASGGSDPERDD